MADTTHKDEQLSEILALDAAGEYSDCGDTLRALSAALERAERERDALVAAAYEAAAHTLDKCLWRGFEDFALEIRALTPDDAREALEKVRRDERERCAKVADTYHRYDAAAAIRGDDDARFREDGTWE